MQILVQLVEKCPINEKRDLAHLIKIMLNFIFWLESFETLFGSYRKTYKTLNYYFGEKIVCNLFLNAFPICEFHAQFH